MGKNPAFQFYPGDWLKDPALSMCAPATRGIWMDLLCAMHENGRSGQVEGTMEQLSRICRCLPIEFDAAINDMKTTKTADVTICNGIVTVISRRMKREEKERQLTNMRVVKYRAGKCNDLNNADETPMKRKCNVPSSSSSSSSSSLASLSSSKEVKSEDIKDSCAFPDKKPSAPARRREYSMSFEMFWKEYPRQVGKGKAFDEWKKIGMIHDGTTAEQIIEAVVKQKRAKHLRVDEPQYIPNPATWLHQRRWEDTVKEVKPSDPTGSRRIIR